MTFGEIWAVLCRKKPKLSKPGAVVEIKAEELKSLLRQAYDKGYTAGSMSETGVFEAFASIFKSKT